MRIGRRSGDRDRDAYEALLELHVDLLNRVRYLERRIGRQVQVVHSEPLPQRIVTDPLRARLLDLMTELEEHPVDSIERRRIHSKMSEVRRQIRNLEDSRRVV